VSHDSSTTETQHKLTIRTALNRAHTSAKDAHVETFYNGTHAGNTSSPVEYGRPAFPPITITLTNSNLNPSVTWSGLLPKSVGLFRGPCV